MHSFYFLLSVMFIFITSLSMNCSCHSWINCFGMKMMYPMLLLLIHLLFQSIGLYFMIVKIHFFREITKYLQICMPHMTYETLVRILVWLYVCARISCGNHFLHSFDILSVYIANATMRRDLHPLASYQSSLTFLYIAISKCGRSSSRREQEWSDDKRYSGTASPYTRLQKKTKRRVKVLFPLKNLFQISLKLIVKYSLCLILLVSFPFSDMTLDQTMLVYMLNTTLKLLKKLKYY